jgi:hypothetical protein
MLAGTLPAGRLAAPSDHNQRVPGSQKGERFVEKLLIENQVNLFYGLE